MSWGLLSVGGKRSAAFGYLNVGIYARVLMGVVLIYAAQVSHGVTNPTDVAAINNLYATLGNPVLPGWVASAGDPCGEAWQGVQCNNSEISSITLNGANLGGELGDSLGMFASILTVDLSNNHIGGVIPSSLPVTLQTFFLSANQFTGTIPSSISSLTQLTAMSLNNNLLTGEIPDALQALTRLINLDLSSNNLSGVLPPSLANLLSLNTLHLQNNQLSGTLDVMKDLPLIDLNVENNLFSGPIPEQLLSIPNFRKDGNLFNDTIASVSPAASPSPPSPPSPPFFPRVPSTPEGQADGPSTLEESKSGKKVLTTKRVVWIAIAGVLLFIVLVLGLVLLIQRCKRGRQDAYGASSQQSKNSYEDNRETLRDNRSWVQPPNQMDKVPKEVAVQPKEENRTWTGRVGSISKPQSDQGRYVQRMGTIPKPEDHEIDMSSFDTMLMPPPPPPPLPPPPPPPVVPQPVEKIINLSVPAEAKTIKSFAKTRKPFTSARSFTIASLQQYTNSFSQDNLIGGGMLGSVYRAQLPDGKLLAVKKLDNRTHQNDDEFLELVDSIDKIRHANVVELAGYCAEHGQRLLIFEYCSNGTLQDALQDDELKNKLSWNLRVRMALGAARALEYLHEVCQPPVVHRNFKSVNVLLDDDLAVHVADCGLAPLMTSGSVSQLSGQLLSAYGYGAPEFESGIYTYHSDVYSFGVVMLELLTGRMSYDRARSRGEQFLVRWAIPQLHDIDALSRMVDPSLNGVYPSKSLSHFADIISRCVQTEPEFRPLMSEVVQDILEMIRKEPPIKRSNSD